jgi:hypothetical protein
LKQEPGFQSRKAEDRIWNTGKQEHFFAGSQLPDFLIHILQVSGLEPNWETSGSRRLEAGQSAVQQHWLTPVTVFGKIVTIVLSETDFLPKCTAPAALLPMRTPRTKPLDAEACKKSPRMSE